MSDHDSPAEPAPEAEARRIVVVAHDGTVIPVGEWDRGVLDRAADALARKYLGDTAAG